MAAQPPRIRNEEKIGSPEAPPTTPFAAGWAEVEAVAGVGSWQYDVTTGKYAWSPGMFRLLGFDQNAGIPTEDAIARRRHHEDAGRYAAALERARTDGTPYTLDMRLVTDDETVRWVHARGHGVTNAQGEVIALFGTLNDITERKEAEIEREAALQALNTSQQQMLHLLKQVNCLLWRAEVHEVPFLRQPWQLSAFDPTRDTALDWDIQGVNEAAAAAPSWLPVDRRADEPLTAVWLRSRDAEDEAAAARTAHEALLAGHPRYTQTFRCRMADGSVRWLLEDVRVDRLPPSQERTRTGERLRRWQLLGVVTEITERKDAEIAREAVLEKLEASRAQLHHVLEQANCLLWQANVSEYLVLPEYQESPEWNWPYFDEAGKTSLDWKMEILNEAEVHRWLPLKQEEGQELATALFLARHPDDGEKIDAVCMTALREHTERYRQTFRVFARDGSVRWLQEDVRLEKLPPVPDAGRSATGAPLKRWRLVGVATDVTERKQTEERLEALAAALHRSNDYLREFAYIASHDLKEPLRKIQTFGDMLRRQSADHLDAEAEDYLERMINAAGRMALLIDGLLQYSRISTRPPEMTPVSLDEVAAGVLSDLEARIVEVDGRVEVESLPTVRADALQMRQLFQNLLANALKFHRPDVPPFVRIAAKSDHHSDSSEVVLVFADNGIGFAPEHAERIFGVFERLDGRRRYEGSGIGLAICRKIAERHGGTIRANATPGKGATFEVVLPQPPASNVSPL
jgi:PAS domain S-box-containing protein